MDVQNVKNIDIINIVSHLIRPLKSNGPCCKEVGMKINQQEKGDHNRIPKEFELVANHIQEEGIRIGQL